VRDWLRAESNVASIPGGAIIYEDYLEFRKTLPRTCARLRLDVEALTFSDFSRLTAIWVKNHT
jgi:hypothetical protein